MFFVSKLIHCSASLREQILLLTNLSLLRRVGGAVGRGPQYLDRRGLSHGTSGLCSVRSTVRWFWPCGCNTNH
jgi:hypothetical protein